MLRFALSVFSFCFLEWSICDERFENVALHKACTMSSYYLNAGSFPADNAVNNNTTGDFVEGNCVHTDFNDYYAYWQVNLSRPYPVYIITVWARTGFLNRMTDTRITVDGQLCYQFPKNTSGLPRKIDVNCTGGVLNGSLVRLTKNGGNYSHPLEYYYMINICEFQVWSCSASYWGSGCDQVCGECRDGAACDKLTGHCDSGCAAGFDSPMCTECEPGRYGINCSQTCGNCSNGVTCRHDNGYCDNGCQVGFEGYRCLKPAADAVTPSFNVEPIVGAVLGAAAVIVVVVIVAAWWIRRSRDHRAASASTASMSTASLSTDNVYNPANQKLSETQFSNFAAATDADGTAHAGREERGSTYDKLQVYENTAAEYKPYSELTFDTL